MEAKRVRYESMGAYIANEHRHPQVVMKELGIVYKRGEPQPIADQWMFHECSNIPEILPDFIVVVVEKP